MSAHAEEVQLPALPGFCMETWLDNSSATLTDILQRAKKSTVVPAAMDCVETQPYELDLDPTEDRCAGLCKIFRSSDELPQYFKN